MLDQTRFLLARNPDEESSLPYLLHFPLEGGLVLKARETWRIDLVLDRRQSNRSRFVFATQRGRGLFKAGHVQSGRLAELAAGLQVRYPQVPLVYYESRMVAEEWTYRFLVAAQREFGPERLGLS